MEEEEKMSEDGSLENESEIDDDESSSGSVDEEIKLNQNFITVLEKIATSNKNYDDYILLLDIAHDLNDLDKIRQSIELFQLEFPLSPTIWLRYLNIEATIAQTEDELKNLVSIFQRALTDYYSIDLAITYASIVSKCSNDMSIEIWNDLLPAYGYEFTKGRIIWSMWREDYMKRNGINEEVCKRVVKKFKEELLLPLNDMKITYTEYREFLEKHSEFVKNIDKDSIEEEVKNTRKILQRVQNYEQKLEKLDDKAHQERISIFRNYIENCEDDLEEEYVQILYERMVAACCLNESVWKSYIKYIQNRPKDWKPLDSNKSKIFLQTELDVINRALRNCTWSADLYIEKMRIFELNNKTREEIQQILEKACAVQYNNADPLVKVWLEYLSYLIRVTNFDDEKQKEILRNNFDLSWHTLSYTFDNLADCDCEILKLWGKIEYTKLDDIDHGRQLWNTVMDSNENYKKAALWIEFSTLELYSRGLDAAKNIFKRALKINDLDDLPGMASYWLRFERVNCCSVESIKACQEMCDKALQHYRRRLMKEKRKFEDTSENKGSGGGVKRKAHNDDNKDDEDDKDYHSKNKKHAPGRKTPDFAKEEFQKLSISSKKIEDQSNENVIDDSKDNVRVFLSNLAFNITIDELRKGFPEITIVNFEMVKSKEGKSLGYGYAELSSELEVKKAFELDRRLIANRPVFISPCQRDRTQRQGFKYSTTLEPNKLFIKGLSFEAKPADLNRAFSEFGAIKDIRIVTKKNGQSKGIAYIEFENEKSASHAVLKMNDTEFMGRKLSVAISAPPPPQPQHPHHADQNYGNVPKHKPAIRSAPESRLSFVPTSVQRAKQLPSVSATTPKTNNDFRNMLLKK